MAETLTHRALRAVVPVERGEQAAVLWAFGYCFCLLCGYYILRPVRDAMGVAGGVRNLPWMYSAVFVVLLALMPVFGALVSRLPRHRFVPLVYRFFAGNIAVFAALLYAGQSKPLVAQVFFVWVTVYNMFVVSVFWSVVVDVFDSGQGKRLFGFIAAGGSTGALVGSWITGAWAESIGLPVLLLISAGFLELTVRCFRQLTRTARHGTRPDGGRALEPSASAPPVRAAIGGSIWAGAVQVFRSAYLSGIGFYLFCISVASTVLYMARAHIVSIAFAGDETRSAFFAMIDVMTSSLTLLLQLLVTARLLRGLGVALTLAVVPVLCFIGFSALAVVPALVVLVAFQVALRASRYAIVRPGREMLFTVVSVEQKYKSKNFVDTAVYRGSDVLSVWGFGSLQAIGLGLAAIAATALPVMALWLGAALLLGRAQTERAKRLALDDSQPG